MLLAHLNEVCRIEAQAHGSHYWPRSAFTEELNKENAAYWVAEGEQEKVLGYIGFNLICAEGFITNLAVDSVWQKQKIGEKLLKHLINKAIEWKIERLSLEVKVSNYKAQNLYKKYGFIEAGRRKNYYGAEDGLVFWTPLIQSETYKQNFLSGE